ncbi:MAG: proton-conducting transporter membrane subunit, partial [Oscillospiraceae bacterium]
MNYYTILFPILLPIIAGAASYFIKFEKEEQRNKYAIIATTLVSVITVIDLFILRGKSVMMFAFNDKLNISFKIDGLSCVFAGMVSFLWPLAVIYATEYMKHEGHQKKFFAFYIMTFGVTLGIAFSANMLTMYLCYELLTFITLPLVMHGMDPRSIYAGKKYLIYSVSGASLSFVGMMVILAKTGSLEFVYGGLLKSADGTVLFAYLLMFIGFGVKAAIVPFHAWLPGASVAPTTVTALLHAVAVVKAGVFAIMRTTFFFFGTTYISGTWVQNVAMIFAIVTICYGSWMAARSQHLKRRLAYSTISQLAYIVFGVTLMSAEGLAGGLSHMLFHGLMKIVLFYVAGAILYTNHKEYVYELEGYAKKMPKSFFLFTICSLSLIGVPPFPGFLSKFALATAAAKKGVFSMAHFDLTSFLA